MESFLAPLQPSSLRRGKLAMGISPDRRVQMVALDELSALVTHVLENPPASERSESTWHPML
jgi:hypothetical protein